MLQGTEKLSTKMKALDSRGLRADAIESVTCGWLSLVVVVALVAQLIIGAWWVDAVASLGIVWFLVQEGREAWTGEDCCDQMRQHARRRPQLALCAALTTHRECDGLAC